MPLSDVLFQDTAIARLRRALASHRVPHAYLFSGPAGVGKEMLATRFAQLLLCTGTNSAQADSGPGLFGAADPEEAALQSEDACGVCTACVLFAAGNHPDFHCIHRGMNKLHPDKKVRDRKATEFSVDVVRHFILEKIMLRPSLGRAKVFILLEAERLNIEAQNAFLKTLEEPPGESYLILLATAPEELLPTTRSRCQHIPLGTLPDTFVTQRLQQDRGLVGRDAAFLTQLAQGSLGQALRYADAGVLPRAAEVFECVQRAAQDPLGASKAIVDLAKDMSKGSKEVEPDEELDTNALRDAQGLILAIAATILRDVQRAAVASPPLAMPGEPIIADWAARASNDRIARAIRAFSSAQYQIHASANAGLIFDGVCIAIYRALNPAAAA